MKPSPKNEVVTAAFKGSGTALVFHNGTTWFVYRENNGGLFGDPPGWFPCEDNLIKSWNAIPSRAIDTIERINAKMVVMRHYRKGNKS